uniref:Putative secreted protein n=1 Tax=Anopheles triannulatus TaxID=58253 RepID=A0A2M4B307_9DIPT
MFRPMLELVGRLIVALGLRLRVLPPGDSGDLPFCRLSALLSISKASCSSSTKASRGRISLVGDLVGPCYRRGGMLK